MTDEQTAGIEQSKPDKVPLMMLLILFVGGFLASFNECLMNMALVAIMQDFSIDTITVQWLVTAYMIVTTVAVMSMAFFYRRFKLRALVMAAALFTLAGSVLGILAPNFAVLLVARVIQSVGSGMLIPIMTNTVLTVVPKSKLGSYLSIGSCCIVFGPAFAPVVCGSIVTLAGWRYVFLIPLIVSFLVLVLTPRFVKNAQNSNATLDFLSVAIAAVALFALTYGLSQLSYDMTLAIGLLAVAVVVFVAFAVRQLRSKHPLIDFAPLRKNSFWPALILQIVGMMTTFSMSVLFPLYFEQAFGVSALTAGFYLLAPVLINAVVAIVSGRLFDRFGEWPMFPAGYLLICVGFVVVICSATTFSVPAIMAGAILIFVGVGLGYTNSLTAGLKTLTPQENPFGVALGNTSACLAACVGPSLFTGLMSGAQDSAQAAGVAAELACAQGFQFAVIVALAIGAIGFVTAFFYARAARKRERLLN